MRVCAFAFTAPDLSFTAPSASPLFVQKMGDPKATQVVRFSGENSKTEIVDGVGDNRSEA
jgi:hypothetical protein